jgi:hypothetical protein
MIIILIIGKGTSDSETLIQAIDIWGIEKTLKKNKWYVFFFNLE